MSKGNIVYDSALSVEDNARLNGVSVATIRRYIKINSIDRRSDKKREILAKINNLLRKKPSITPNEICAELGYSLNTIKKYLKFDINSVRTEIGKISAYDLTKKNNVILSVSDNQNEILKSIIKLHNNSQQFECDLTYSIGNFYLKLPAPKYKFDKYPQMECVQNLDEAELLPSNSLNSIIFDLPFIIHSDSPTKMCNRFNYFNSPQELYKANDSLLSLSYRLLKKKGLLVVKTMDASWANKQCWVSNYVLNKADELGFEHIDTFILNPKTKIICNIGIKQHCARKWHSYFFVFKKYKTSPLEG